MENTKDMGIFMRNFGSFADSKDCFFGPASEAYRFMKNQPFRFVKNTKISHECTHIFSVFHAIFRALSNGMGFRWVKPTKTMVKMKKTFNLKKLKKKIFLKKKMLIISFFLAQIHK